MLKRVKEKCVAVRDFGMRLHRSEQGAEGIEKLLIIGAIVLPLLIVLIWFRNEISAWAKDKWSAVQSEADADI
ncbi:hypothetical protein JD969_01025 [Planctomycetota bacterium]|nr:hypothetical protein JD969_01025 [Planctomycetota bacterium]